MRVYHFSFVLLCTNRGKKGGGGVKTKFMYFCFRFPVYVKIYQESILFQKLQFYLFVIIINGGTRTQNIGVRFLSGCTVRCNTLHITSKLMLFVHQCKINLKCLFCRRRFCCCRFFFVKEKKKGGGFSVIICGVIRILPWAVEATFLINHLLLGAGSIQSFAEVYIKDPMKLSPQRLNYKIQTKDLNL